MRVSHSVTAYVSPKNKTYKKHANVVKACLEAGVEFLPKETAEYFGSNSVDKNLLHEKLETRIPVKEVCEDDGFYYEILVKDIPKDVYKIWFVK